MLTVPESELRAPTLDWGDDYSRIGEGRGGEAERKQNVRPTPEVTEEHGRS